MCIWITYCTYFTQLSFSLLVKNINIQFCFTFCKQNSGWTKSRGSKKSTARSDTPQRAGRSSQTKQRQDKEQGQQKGHRDERHSARAGRSHHGGAQHDQNGSRDHEASSPDAGLDDHGVVVVVTAGANAIVQPNGIVVEGFAVMHQIQIAREQFGHRPGRPEHAQEGCHGILAANAAAVIAGRSCFHERQFLYELFLGCLNVRIGIHFQ